MHDRTMTPVRRSLMYDAIVLVITVAVALLADGFVQDLAALTAAVTLLKAPYDV